MPGYTVLAGPVAQRLEQGTNNLRRFAGVSDLEQSEGEREPAAEILSEAVGGRVEGPSHYTVFICAGP